MSSSPPLEQSVLFLRPARLGSTQLLTLILADISQGTQGTEVYYEHTIQHVSHKTHCAYNAKPLFIFMWLLCSPAYGHSCHWAQGLHCSKADTPFFTSSHLSTSCLTSIFWAALNCVELWCMKMHYPSYFTVVWVWAKTLLQIQCKEEMLVDLTSEPYSI